jgi:putative ABC transport system permease protein
MLHNYWITTLRSLRRNPLFSSINIVGLAIGLSACFLIWQYVRFESSYDTFHANANLLYRVPLQTVRNGVVVNEQAANMPALGPSMKADLPEVKQYCRLVETSLFTGDISSYVANALEFSREDNKGKVIAFNEEAVWFTDPSFLDMFSFRLIEGTHDALREPNSVVLTLSTARKYFGTASALGKELRLNRQRLLTVTAVIEDVPENSHLQFDILISFSSMLPNFGDGSDFWGWSAFYTYIQLAPSANPDALQAKLPAFTKRRLGKNNEGEYQMRFYLQPITDIHLKSQLANELSQNSSERLVWFLSLLAGFILIVAWINYINLSTAKALERSKEVGLRKTVGATRPQLIAQFMFDTFVVNGLALLIAAIIVFVTWPAFERLTGKTMREVLLKTAFVSDVSFWLMGSLILFAGILVAGAYPAFTLSSFNPAKVLKGTFYKSASGVFLRKLMISFQYVLTVLLLAGTVTIYLQITYMRNQDPGFAREQVIVLEAPAVYDSAAGDKVAVFKNEALQIPGVVNVTASSDIPGRMIVEHPAVTRANDPEFKDAFGAFMPAVDTSFFSAYEIKLLEGRLFDAHELMTFRAPKGKPELIRLIVNEAFVKRLNLNTPKDALSEKIKFWWGPDERHAEIIGVVADHHQQSFKEHVEPIAYMQPQWTGWKYFSVKVNGAHPRTVAELELAYKRTFPENAVSWFFLDDFFDRQYKEDVGFGRIFNVFTVLAIIVTCLGLLGLSVFSVTQRTKEVGIRKVLGASSLGIMYLFSKDFMKLLLLAYVVAVPVIYLAGVQWLSNFTYRIPIAWQMFVLPLLVLIFVTLTTSGFISVRAAIDTPVKALRQE